MDYILQVSQLAGIITAREYMCKVSYLPGIITAWYHNWQGPEGFMAFLVMILFYVHWRGGQCVTNSHYYVTTLQKLDIINQWPWIRLSHSIAFLFQGKLLRYYWKCCCARSEDHETDIGMIGLVCTKVPNSNRYWYDWIGGYLKSIFWQCI